MFALKHRDEVHDGGLAEDFVAEVIPGLGNNAHVGCEEKIVISTGDATRRALCESMTYWTCTA